MKISEVVKRSSPTVNELIEVWERSVKATHLFLSEDEVKEIKKYIPQALDKIAHLVVAEEDSGHPIAFMGIEG